MLYVTWLIFKGSLDQARINLEVAAPVTGAPLAIVYASGIVFAVSAAVLLVRDIWRALSGRMSEAELVMVKEEE
jgi:TRAP-type C4-dicarboxylate transport system permease small subunit